MVTISSQVVIYMSYIINAYCIGKPVDNPSDIDYIPSKFAYKSAQQSEALQRQRVERARRLDKRRQVRDDTERESGNKEMAVEGLLLLQEAEYTHDAHTQTSLSVSSNAATQTPTTDVQSVSIQTLESQSSMTIIPYPYYIPISSNSPQSQVKIIVNNDDATKFNTGLPSWSIFEYLLNFISEDIPLSKLSKLSPADCLLLTLMRLRLNLTINDLAYRFGTGVSVSTAGSVFTNWIEDLFLSLKCLIKWPTQQIAYQNLPPIFKDLYPNARCIIDCSEIFIERPYGYVARAQTYSNYKKNNTIKFLIAVTPCGAICFLSKLWGGRASDRCITMNSGLLELLENGDVILADRGFTISDDVSLHGAKLEIPAFTTGKKQLNLKEVEESKRLSKVRIHVERVIGLLKNKYTILQGKLPVSMLTHKNDSEYAFIDKIVTVCAALTNLSPSVVPQ